MIRTQQPPPDLTIPADPAWLAAVVERHDLTPVVAGGFLYAIRKTPLFAQPLIYVARCEVRRG